MVKLTMTRVLFAVAPSAIFVAIFPLYARAAPPLMPPMPPGVSVKKLPGEDVRCGFTDNTGNYVEAWGTMSGCRQWIEEAAKNQFTVPEPPGLDVRPPPPKPKQKDLTNVPCGAFSNGGEFEIEYIPTITAFALAAINTENIHPSFLVGIMKNYAQTGLPYSVESDGMAFCAQGDLAPSDTVNIEGEIMLRLSNFYSQAGGVGWEAPSTPYTP